jgi:hypothetical protein
MNLLEVVIALAIAMAMLMLGTMFFSNVTGAREFTAVRTLVSQIRLAQQQATIENRVYRVVFDLDSNSFMVEAGGAEALTYRDPEQRQEMEEKLQEDMGDEKAEEELKQLIRCAQSQQQNAGASCDGLADLEMDPEQALALLEEKKGGSGGFQAASKMFFDPTKAPLPNGVLIAGVYTPAYGEYLRPLEEDEREEEDVRQVAFAHIFPGGVSEHTVIQIVREGREDFGYTIEIEPLSGKITVDSVVRDWDDRDYEIPENGPELDG